MDDCILSSLSLPPGTKPVMNAASCSPAVRDSNSPEHRGGLDAPFNAGSLERTSRWSSEMPKQRPDMRDSNGRELRVMQPCGETIDLTTSSESADTDLSADDNGASGGQLLRKRKMSGGGDIPSKQPAEAFL